MHNLSRRMLFSASAIAALSGAMASGAAAAAPADQGNAVQEVVVTALRREQKLLKVPVTVTAVTSQTLNEAGVTDMKSLSNLVPGLVAIQNNTPLNQSYRVRGVGADPNTPTFEPDVGLFVDGVYLPRSGLGVSDLVDITRVEVLEGPQSTLYGKNVTGGVVNVVTKAPSTTFEAHMDATLSEFDTPTNALAERVDGSVSGPITDKIQGRFTVVGYHQAASFENLQPGGGSVNDWNRYTLRGELQFNLGANTDLRLAYARSEIPKSEGINPDLYIPTNSKLYLIPAALHGVFPSIAPCTDTNPNDRILCTTDPIHAQGHTDIASATLTSHIGRNTFTSITAYSDYLNDSWSADIGQVLDPVITFNDIQKGETFTQELRLTSPGGEKLDWLVGAYFMRNDLNRGNDGKTPAFVLGAAAPYLTLSGPVNFGQPGDEGFLNSSAASDYWAVFGQGTYHFDDKFALTLGARAQDETKTASIDNSNVTSPLDFHGINLIDDLLTPTSVNAEFNNSLKDITWNATGEFHPTDRTMLYLTYSRGAKAGGTNNGFGNSPDSVRPFKDEFVDNYETGGKFSLLDNRLTLSLAAFHTIYHDYQNAGFVGLQYLVDNAQQVSVNGAEANASAALGHGLTVNGAATYINARYDTYTGGACYYGRTPTNVALGQCDLSGSTLPFSPHWRTNLNLTYKHPVSFGQFYSRLDWSWSSSYMDNTNLDPRNVQKDYSLVNGRIGVTAGHGFDLSVFANNLFNQTVDVQAGVPSLFGNDPAYSQILGPARELGVTVRKAF